MLPSILPIPLLIALSAALSIPQRLDTRDAGPIPIQTPAQGWPYPQSVTFRRRAGGLPDASQSTLATCLTAYSIGRFYDGWDGNECGGMGWFKGGGHVGAAECYRVCATYVLYQGIKGGQTDFQCDFRKGVHGHCWMGYHPLENGGGNGMAAVATS